MVRLFSWDRFDKQQNYHPESGFCLFEFPHNLFPLLLGPKARKGEQGSVLLPSTYTTSFHFLRNTTEESLLPLKIYCADRIRSKPMHTRPAFIPYRVGTLGILPESLPNKTDLFYIYIECSHI